MAENLMSYQLQLEQVEAALNNKPNEQLLMLKKDLQEAILLTHELIEDESPAQGGADMCDMEHLGTPSEQTSAKSRKRILRARKEKKKAQKKAQQIEKWNSFYAKSFKKGIVKRSIFASPENVNGRVGIGTCGIGGRPMTKVAPAVKQLQLRPPKSFI